MSCSKLKYLVVWAENLLTIEVPTSTLDCPSLCSNCAMLSRHSCRKLVISEIGISLRPKDVTRRRTILLELDGKEGAENIFLYGNKSNSRCRRKNSASMKK